MDQFIIENWQWFYLGFTIIEKIVKITPTKKDDVIVDMILKPIYEKFSNKMGSK